MANRLRSKILLGFGAFVLFLSLLIWVFSSRSRQEQAQLKQSPPLPSPSATIAPATTPSASNEATPAASSASPENSPPPEATPDTSTPAAPSTPGTVASPDASSNAATLLIPVAGVRPEQLRDTFQEARSEGRVHDAIDIPAARGAPVLAAADGRVVKFFNSERGGLTIYQLSADEHLVYYYAHLERYADGLTEGHFARRGEVIAYVGDTGNAGPGNYHLHFSVAIINDPKHYWNGTNINPYPMLRGATTQP